MTTLPDQSHARSPDRSTCPACRTNSLQVAELEPLLPSRRCDRCRGEWIRGEHYARWREHPDRAANVHPDAAPSGHAAVEAHDSVRAMLCPDCGRFLTRSKVGHGVSFSINRCGGCGGIWLDANEWEALRGSGLSDRIQFVFSAAWQAEVLREQQQAAAQKLLVERIGKEDFDELQRLLAWVEKHPHRNQIIAWLFEHLRDSGAGSETRG